MESVNEVRVTLDAKDIEAACLEYIRKHAGFVTIQLAAADKNLIPDTLRFESTRTEGTPK